MSQPHPRSPPIAEKNRQTIRSKNHAGMLLIERHGGIGPGWRFGELGLVLLDDIGAMHLIEPQQWTPIIELLGQQIAAEGDRRWIVTDMQRRIEGGISPLARAGFPGGDESPDGAGGRPVGKQQGRLVAHARSSLSTRR
jgi:hypothetical protein